MLFIVIILNKYALLVQHNPARNRPSLVEGRLRVAPSHLPSTSEEGASEKIRINPEIQYFVAFAVDLKNTSYGDHSYFVEIYPAFRINGLNAHHFSCYRFV